MAEPRKQPGRHALDLDVSTTLIAERMVGEIFGWDLVDWPAVEPHKGRKFFFGHQRQRDPSIFNQLKPLLDQTDPGKNDMSALKPSPIINDSLGRLVGHLCRHVGRHGLLVDESKGPVLERTEAEDRLHLLVIEHLFARINASAVLAERAACLKRIAAAAENELEKHFADMINDRLEQSFLPGGKEDQQKINSLEAQARSRIAEARGLNERELAGLAVPKLALDEDALVRFEMARILLNRFPYVRNYELMLYAELAMLQQPLTPRFVRERMFSGKDETIDAASIERFDQAILALSSRLEPFDASLAAGTLPNKTIAICGSGPLPLSALFLHLFTGAAVVLVDHASNAIDRSKRLIANLERLGILAPGLLNVRQANAGQVRFRTLNNAAEDSVICDAVMIANLVDNSAKASIAAQIESDPDAPPLLITRSATGLSARLAYDAVPTETFSRNHLAYCGETIPATQISTHLDRPEAARRGVACSTSPDTLAIAHPDVVNTTEVYRRVPVAYLDVGVCKTMDDAIRQLDNAAARLTACGPRKSRS